MGAAGEIILLVERAGKPEHTFAPALRHKGFAIEVVSSGQLALKCLKELAPVAVILNSASLGSSGFRICHQLQAAAGAPIVHIVPENTLESEKQGVAEITLLMPFTARKLINSVRRLMPASRLNMVVAGPIRLAPGARVVEAYGREKRLTVRTARLLNLFLKHPGEILDRGYLMRQIWQTDYMGDTRTLDVHIRWVREAVEPDPTNPRHILTVRGRGYRFEVDPNHM